jgi:hypothetical protein
MAGWVDQTFVISDEARTPAPSQKKPLSDDELLRQLHRDTTVSLRDQPKRWRPVDIARISYSTRHLDRLPRTYDDDEGPDDA